MTALTEYQRVGKFIYGACRHGGGMVDVYNWMADDLGVARPRADDTAQADLITAFFAKHGSDQAFLDTFERFLETLRSRRT